MRRTSRPFFAGTWINLQDAYAVEANTLGDWNQIGYSAPGTKQTSAQYKTDNFTYDDVDFTVAKATWQATAAKVLNDCAIGKTWVLEATTAVSTADANRNYIKFEAKGDAECLGLTPSFTKLTRTGEQ